MKFCQLNSDGSGVGVFAGVGLGMVGVGALGTGAIGTATGWLSATNNLASANGVLTSASLVSNGIKVGAELLII